MALLLVASSCSDDSSSNSIVIASIEGRELTRGQLDDLLPDGDNTVDTRVHARRVELEHLKGRRGEISNDRLRCPTYFKQPRKAVRT